jgi:putative flippase GtrA
VLCCLTVSVGTTLLSAVVLVALVVGAGVPAGTANVIAVCCGIVPSYLGNRRWTWGRSGRGSVAREVVPFWVLSLAGLLLSTVTVALAGAATAAWPDSVRSIVLPLAQAGTFAALWVVQFVLLDRVIFRTTAAPKCALPDIPVDQQRVAA